MNKFIFALFIFAFIFSMPVIVMADDTIKVKAFPVVHVGEGRVFLGDIAEITGPKDDVEKLKGVFIARAPKPGQYVRVSRKTVIYKINQTGCDPSKVELDFPVTLNIYPFEQKIESEAILQAAIDYIKQNKIVKEDELDSLRNLMKPRSFYVPKGTVQFKCEQLKTTNPSLININVSLVCDGKTYVQSKVNFRKGVTKKPAATGTEVGETNSDKKDRSSGHSVNKGVRVNAGDPLEITVHRKNLVITVTGTAIQSGYAGQYIKVRIDDSKKILPALIKDKRHAQIVIP